MPASMVFEVVFRMFSAGARTEKKLRQGVKSSHVVACIVIDDFMRVMRMCYQVLTCEPPREMKCQNYFNSSQGDKDFLAKFSKLKLAGVNMGTDDAVRLAELLSTNKEHLGKLQELDVSRNQIAVGALAFNEQFALLLPADRKFTMSLVK